MAGLTPVSAIVQAARSLEGLPFHHRGHSVSGVDCIGLLLLSTREAGLELVSEDRARSLGGWLYSRDNSPKLLQAAEELLEPTRELAPGTVLLFKWISAQWPQHFGLYLGEVDVGGAFAGEMIHAAAAHKKVVRCSYSRPWTQLLHSMYRFRGVDYSG